MDDDAFMMILLLLGGVFVVWYLTSNRDTSPVVPKIQPDSCKAAGVAYGVVPLCTTAVTKAAPQLFKSVAADLGFVSSPPSIEGCPYGTRDLSTGVMQRTQAEVNQCLAWLNACMTAPTKYVPTGVGNIKVPIPGARVCSPPADTNTKGWRG